MTPLIDVRNVYKEFNLNSKKLEVLRDVSFSISQGETLGLVGESGCGKSTLAKAIMQIYGIEAGEILFQGVPLRQGQSLKGEIQLVFQDPGSSLNPRMTAGEIIREPLDIFSSLSKKMRKEKVYELLDLVGLQPYHYNQYPHEFSGGQKQRICIARALSLEPKFLILDEPISALDLSIQAQIVTLLEDIQKRLRLTYLFISHDLAMVKYISNRVAVMYRGEIVELADSNTLFLSPKHPYTRALIDAIPIPDPETEKGRKRHLLQGDPPPPFSYVQGCCFASRCPLRSSRCDLQRPPMKMVAQEHSVRCLFSE